MNQTHDLQQMKRTRQLLHNTDDVYVDVKWTSRTAQLVHVQFYGLFWVASLLKNIRSWLQKNKFIVPIQLPIRYQ